MAGLEKTNFDFLSAFRLDFQSFVAHFNQLNKTNFIGFLFCRVDEAYILRSRYEEWESCRFLNSS